MDDSAFILFAMIVISELLLRVFSPIYLTGNIDAYQYDAELGVRLKDNIHQYKTTDYQQEIYTNQFGTVNFQNTFLKYPEKVFAIGDSYTQGTGLPVDASYPFQLSLMLNVDRDDFVSKFGVINLGLAAFGTRQAIISVNKYRQIYGNPDYILYLGSWNDYSDDRLFAAGYRHEHLVEGSPNWTIWSRSINWFANHSEIGKRLKIIFARLKQKSYIKKSTNPEISNHGERSIAERQKDQLENLFHLSQKIQAKLIVSWSDPPTKQSSSYHWLQQWADEKNVGFADWHRQLESIRGVINDIPLYNAHSGGHYRSWVNYVIARSFAYHIQMDNPTPKK